MDRVYVVHNCAMSNYPQVFANYKDAIAYVVERCGRPADIVYGYDQAEWTRNGQTTWRVISRQIEME